MPDVLVEVRRGWLEGQGPSFLDAIQTAMVETLGIPAHDKILRLVEHAPDHFAIPESASERFTHIEITLFAGRSLATKRALYEAIVLHLEVFGVPPGDIKIILIEVSRDSVGMRGGKPASELDLGYDILPWRMGHHPIFANPED